MEEPGSKSSGLKILKLGALILILIILPILGFMVGRNSSPTAKVIIASPTPASNAAATDETSNWKTFQGADFTFKYPYLWKTQGNEFVSEVSFTPGYQDTRRTYNIVDVKKYKTPLFLGYTNKKWFEKIDNQNTDDTVSDQRFSRTKIASGTTQTGESYVIFKQDPSPSSITIPTHQVIAYILKDSDIYVLTLDLYDLGGLDSFQKLVPTFKTANSS